MSGDLDEEVHMRLPLGYEPPLAVQAKFPNQPLTCRLLRSLYGLQQSPGCWFLKLGDALLHYGFEQASSDHSSFILSTTTSITVRG